MNTSRSATRRKAVHSALATALYLSGGMLVGIGLGFLVNGLPMHVPELTKNVLSSIPTLATLVAVGGLWGRAIARISGSDQTRRMVWAGTLSFGPIVLLTAIALTLLEVAIVERGRGPSLPIHIVFTMLFVPAVFLVAGVGSLALGIALKDWKLASKLALGGGSSAALAFLLVNVSMDALGWRVGAPGAVERATMLTVTMVGSLAAALAGGAAVGLLLALNPGERSKKAGTAT